MAAAKLQLANGAKKCENGRPKRSETDTSESAKTSLKVQKAVENKRKQTKECENDRGGFC